MLSYSVILLPSVYSGGEEQAHSFKELWLDVTYENYKVDPDDKWFSMLNAWTKEEDPFATALWKKE